MTDTSIKSSELLFDMICREYEQTWTAIRNMGIWSPM